MIVGALFLGRYGLILTIAGSGGLAVLALCIALASGAAG
jgi:hypothetical protein